MRRELQRRWHVLRFVDWQCWSFGLAVAWHSEQTFWLLVGPFYLGIERRGRL